MLLCDTGEEEERAVIADCDKAGKRIKRDTGFESSDRSGPFKKPCKRVPTMGGL